eukprot:scaffold24.g2937.t1
MITPEELAQGRVYPDLNKIRDISLAIAVETMRAAADEGHVHNPSALMALARCDETLRAYIASHMYYPKYTRLVHSRLASLAATFDRSDAKA